MDNEEERSDENMEEESTAAYHHKKSPRKRVAQPFRERKASRTGEPDEHVSSSYSQ
jgi:hypothetical protein